MNDDAPAIINEDNSASLNYDNYTCNRLPSFHQR